MASLQNEALLTAKEAAFLLRISERTVRHLLNEWRESEGTKGIPGGFKVGSDWRISETILKSWIDNQRMFGLKNENIEKDAG
jgi:hypothetical protein